MGYPNQLNLNFTNCIMQFAEQKGNMNVCRIEFPIMSRMRLYYINIKANSVIKSVTMTVPDEKVIIENGKESSVYIKGSEIAADLFIFDIISDSEWTVRYSYGAKLMIPPPIIGYADRIIPHNPLSSHIHENSLPRCASEIKNMKRIISHITSVEALASMILKSITRSDPVISGTVSRFVRRDRMIGNSQKIGTLVRTYEFAILIRSAHPASNKELIPIDLAFAPDVWSRIRIPLDTRVINLYLHDLEFARSGNTSRNIFPVKIFGTDPEYEMVTLY